MELMRSTKLDGNGRVPYRYYIDGKSVSETKYREVAYTIITNGSYSCAATKVVKDRVRYYCSGRA